MQAEQDKNTAEDPRDSNAENTNDPQVQTESATTGDDKDASGEEKHDNTPEEGNAEDEIAKLNDKYLRLFAEFENYKRRTSKERIELFTSANKELMTAMLPVLDDFERAFKNTKDEDATREVVKGFNLIYNKMLETMRQKGLKPMDDCTGKPFDIDTMEAITKIPAPEKSMKGKVIDQIERGYKLGDKVVRYARVVVGE